MAYTVLARRYRSSTFDEVVGQTHVAQTLKRAIESGRIAHAYLFCGTRGTGKTSMARIFAKALNCDRAQGPTTTPCGECSSCQGIARGDDIDVIELDAASNRGIDEVRKIIENSRLVPARSRFKVYIIDEVHAMTKDAFNALLKVLEEPASHVKFVLATTEAEKVLPTILSRCQRYDFHNIPLREIATHLASVCRREGVEPNEDALLMVARSGNGSMRDAISVLDRLLCLGEKQLSAEMVEQLLGMPRGRLIFDLVQRIGEGDVPGTLSQLEAMLASGFSADTLLVAMVEHLRNLMVIRACGEQSDLVQATTIAPAELAAQAGRFDLVFLSQDIVVLEELRRQIRQTQAHRALLDATMVRLALTEQFTPIGELADNPAAQAALPAAQKKKGRERIAGRDDGAISG
jgi:DNA polymerase-3 subunit gamma/tau